MMFLQQTTITLVLHNILEHTRVRMDASQKAQALQQTKNNHGGIDANKDTSCNCFKSLNEMVNNTFYKVN